MKNKLEQSGADARAAARSAYERLMLSLFRGEDLEEPGETPLMFLKFQLERVIAQANKGRLEAKTLNDIQNLRFALSVPLFYEWSEDTGETETDPISGNARPKFVRCRKCGSETNVLMEIRELFKGFVRSLAALSRRVQSPTYPQFRAAYLSLCAFENEHAVMETMPRQDVDRLADELDRQLFELAADLEIAACDGKGGRHG